jgi:hypothetical protein
MPLTEYADIAAQNLGWLIAIGLAVCLFVFFTFTISRLLFHIQKELGQLSEDVTALRLAEERRFLTELKQGCGEGAAFANCAGEAASGAAENSGHAISADVTTVLAARANNLDEGHRRRA